MRTPQDLPSRARKARVGRGRWWIVAVVVVLVVILASLKSLATLYTDSLWFSSVRLHRVWSTLLAIKVGLFASFGAVFFVVLWVNLLVCDRLASSTRRPRPRTSWSAATSRPSVPTRAGSTRRLPSCWR